MPPIEVGPTRAIGAVTADIARKASSPATTTPAPTTPAPAAAVNAKASVSVGALDAGSAPVDTDRVAQIRKAVESGEYPLVPARIADAMIAAGILLRTGKA